MGHRHHSSSNMFTINQSQNQNHITAEQPYVLMGSAVAPENVSAVCPTDNMLRGIHCDSQWMAESRANEYLFSSFGTEVSHVPPAFSVPPYPFHYSSSARNMYLAPENNAGYYNGPIIHEIENGLLDPTTGIGRAPFKRKSPDVSGVRERGSTSRFYDAGSSSRSSWMLLENSTSACHSPGLIGLPQYGGNSLSISSEDSTRNVRSRSRLDFSASAMRTHLSNHSSHHPYQSTIHPSNLSGIVNSANLNADVTTQGRNTLPPAAAAVHGTVPTSDISGSRHMTNQLLVGASAAEIGGYHHGSFSGQPFLPPSVPASQYHHGPPQTSREGCSNHAERAMPSYRSAPSYSHFGHDASSSNSDIHSLSEGLLSTYSRPLSGGGWHNSFQNGRLRMAPGRFQSICNVVDGHYRMGYEASMVVDRLSPDQHRDMRLDIDSMTYEQLLALGERIGNVSTGLSEDMIATCLMQTMHCSSVQNPEEETCSICLEEYKNAEKVGTMKNCGHVYHVSCIRKWLSMKNVCPICKSAALTDCSKEG